MKKKLISLKDHNKRVIERTLPKGNGIECPKCGEELFDIDSHALLSYPPQKGVKCVKCNFWGSRYV